VRRTPPPPITVILDPDDTAAYVHTALAAHDPAAGHITLHPAPGTAGDTYLAHDLLAALGKPPLLPGRYIPGAEHVWQAVSAWFRAIPVTRLTVLRAHLLGHRRLERLLDLREFTGLQLNLVCHRPRLPPVLQRALHHTSHTVTSGLGPARQGFGPPAQIPPAPSGRTANRWITLPALDRFDSLDSSSHCLGTCTPPMINFRHRPKPRPRSETTIREITRRIHTRTAHPRLAATLAAAVFTGTAAHQLATARLEDYDDHAATLALHDPARFVDGCATHRVPAWARTFLRAAACIARLVPAEGCRMLAQPDDYRDLMRFAEDARLRPPQPPVSERTLSGVDWYWRELKEIESLDAMLAQDRIHSARWNRS
jgi:hypothetical protein